MLSEKRIKEAEANVKSYLNEGLLTKSEFNKNVFNILRNNAHVFYFNHSIIRVINIVQKVFDTI